MEKDWEHNVALVDTTVGAEGVAGLRCPVCRCTFESDVLLRAHASGRGVHARNKSLGALSYGCSTWFSV